MNKPVLIIMAAGMGSRYGGLKQMDPVGANGELILDYSLFDARRAGFERAVIVIKKENEEAFRQVLGDRVSKHMQIDYAYQDLLDVPEGYQIPEGRKKPWGTGHAIYAARDLVDAPFCAINADDFYGYNAFKLAYEHLCSLKDDGDVAMVGYLLKNTLSESGSVARGVCTTDETGKLLDLTERTHIIPSMDGPLMTEDMQTYTRLSEDTVVSMNMWGFPAAMMQAIKDGFPKFLNEDVPKNPEKAEYFLPKVVDTQLSAGNARVSVLTTPDKWYGVTYAADKQDVVDALSRMHEAGEYPTPLWGCTSDPS
ncbi:MAG: nucleotidyltransferase [Clostridiales bacterium]|nr:nucleotidyltransferase [Clostridiales bacterium]